MFKRGKAKVESPTPEPALTQRTGLAIGQEARGKGVNVILGPMMCVVTITS
jgi:beta-glucosidase-like glycosyl hydrolase